MCWPALCLLRWALATNGGELASPALSKPDALDESDCFSKFWSYAVGDLNIPFRTCHDCPQASRCDSQEWCGEGIWDAALDSREVVVVGGKRVCASSLAAPAAVTEKRPADVEAQAPAERPSPAVPVGVVMYRVRDGVSRKVASLYETGKNLPPGTLLYACLPLSPCTEPPSTR